MALNIGDRLGHYDVTALIGEGGMGQVYRATDTQLNRDVALKILPDAFAADPDRLSRFQREAQVLASLNHPGIAAIYGTEEDKTDGTRALVLELVEGPTLADRIAKGPIPLDEALPIAKQIAEALEAAHEAGVIHRDLKPANIKVREDGTVKVLDFGLAKALDTTPASDPSQSPTLTAAATQMGVIMGTAAYMSPEQARGKPTDRRADIWSFGAVLFEMLTGRRVFRGRDVSETLAAVIQSSPEWGALNRDTPLRLANLLRRCLEKEPKQRVQAIGDVRLAMEGAFETTIAAPLEPTAAPQPQVWQRPISIVLLVVISATLVGLGVWTAMHPEVEPADVMRFAIVASDDAPMSSSAVTGRDRDIAVSADGKQVVYTGPVVDGNGSQLYVRTINQLAGAPLRGGEGGGHPVVSPDGAWVAFLNVTSRQTLRKVSIFGGTPVTVAESPDYFLGISWEAENQ